MLFASRCSVKLHLVIQGGLLGGGSIGVVIVCIKYNLSIFFG